MCPPIWYDIEKIKETKLSNGAILFAISYLLFDFQPKNLKDFDVDAIREEFSEYMKRMNFDDIHQFYYHIAVESDTFIESCDGCKSTANLTKARFCDTICFKIYAEDVDSRLQTVSEPIQMNLLPQNYTGGEIGIPEIRKYHALIIDNDEKFPIPVKEMLLEKNTITGVYVTPKVNIFVNTDERPCDPNTDTGYSQKLCHSDCIQKTGYAQCKGCFMMDFFIGDMNDGPKYPLCNALKSPPIITECRFALINGAKECSKKCPNSCKQKMLDISLFTSKQFVGTTSADLSGDKTVIQIYYQVANFGIQTFEEVLTYSFETMVSNVGGQLGLWIGASIMTLVQLVIFCVRMCYSETACRIWRREKSTFLNEKF